MTNSTKIKILDYSVALVFIILLLTSHLNIPPSSYFISIYCNVFDTDEYYPMLITALLSLTYSIPIIFIKMNLSKKNKNKN